MKVSGTREKPPPKSSSPNTKVARLRANTRKSRTFLAAFKAAGSRLLFLATEVDTGVITSLPPASMEPLRLTVLVLHISAAAMLLGSPTGLTRNLKASLEAGKAAFNQAAKDAARRSSVIGGSAILTLLTGLALIFIAGGFGRVPLNFHVALLIMLGMLVVAAVLVRPPITKIVSIAGLETLDKDAALKHIKKQAIGTGILHLLWFVNLVLMLVHFYR